MVCNPHATWAASNAVPQAVHITVYDFIYINYIVYVMCHPRQFLFAQANQKV